jgi:hypothetical protein
LRQLALSEIKNPAYQAKNNKKGLNPTLCVRCIVCGKKPDLPAKFAAGSS